MNCDKILDEIGLEQDRAIPRIANWLKSQPQIDNVCMIE
jgi:hypothetical protein